MYSFHYDESKKWAIWPNHLSLSEFTSKRSATIISQMFRYFFDDVREHVNNIENRMEWQKSVLKNALNELDTDFRKYTTTVKVGDNFVR